MTLLDDYKIHRDTYLIRTIHEEDRSYSLIYEKGRQLCVSTKPLKLIDKACQAIGTNFQTATETARLMLGNKLKVPVIVGFENRSPFIMFPLYSPKSRHNIWLSYNTILNVGDLKKKIVVTFKDDTKIELPVLSSSFNKQFATSALLAKQFEENWRQFNAEHDA